MDFLRPDQQTLTFAAEAEGVLCLLHARLDRLRGLAGDIGSTVLCGFGMVAGSAGGVLAAALDRILCLLAGRLPAFRLDATSDGVGCTLGAVADALEGGLLAVGLQCGLSFIACALAAELQVSLGSETSTGKLSIIASAS